MKLEIIVRRTIITIEKKQTNNNNKIYIILSILKLSKQNQLVKKNTQNKVITIKIIKHFFFFNNYS